MKIHNEADCLRDKCLVWKYLKSPATQAAQHKPLFMQS